jgi:ABC-2 type transport system ATP-binding protein
MGVVLLALAVVAGACSSSDDTATGTDSTPASSTSASVGPGAATAPECTQEPTISPVEAEPVPDVASDVTITSFDDTEIRAHWFPAPDATADSPAPTVLMGPGWSQPGDVSTDGDVLFGAHGISAMNERGINVLTWDPRGFGESTGQANVNSPDHEGRDAQVLLDWVAEQPEALLDRAGDPRAGMAGFSYGGGIQLILAAIDCRVDVLVPGIAWNSLVTSLGKNETLKAGWAGLLVDIVTPDQVHPYVIEAYEEGVETAQVSDEHREWFAARGPGDLIDQVNVPTLFVQGTVDALFTLDEAVTNYTSLKDRGVPVKMLWFCGGHGACLTDPGDPERIAEASFAWFDRYLFEDSSVDTGPEIDIIDQDGTRWTGDAYPAEAGEPMTGSGSGTLELLAEGGAGATAATPADGDVVGSFSGRITPSVATNAVEVTLSTDEEALVVGAPKLTFTYSGQTPAGGKPNRVFAQLVDDERGVVVGNQITPVEVTLDGETRTAEVDLEIVAQHLEPGQTLRLQLVATTVAYAVPQLGGSITFDSIDITLPTVIGLTRG